MGPQKRPLGATDFNELNEPARRPKTAEMSSALSVSDQSMRCSPAANHSPARDTGLCPVVPVTHQSLPPERRGAIPRSSNDPPSQRPASAAPSNTALSLQDGLLPAVSLTRDWTFCLARSVDALNNHTNAKKRVEQEQANFQRMQPNFGQYKAFEETNRNSLNYAKKWEQDAGRTMQREINHLDQSTAHFFTELLQELKRTATDQFGMKAQFQLLAAQVAAKDQQIADLTARVDSLEKQPASAQPNPRMDDQVTRVKGVVSRMNAVDGRLQQIERELKAMGTGQSTHKTSMTEQCGALQSKCTALESLVKQTESELKALRQDLLEVDSKRAVDTTQLGRTVNSLKDSISGMKWDESRFKKLEESMQSQQKSSQDDHNRACTLDKKIQSLDLSVSTLDKTVAEGTTFGKQAADRLAKVELAVKQGRNQASPGTTESMHHELDNQKRKLVGLDQHLKDLMAHVGQDLANIKVYLNAQLAEMIHTISAQRGQIYKEINESLAENQKNHCDKMSARVTVLEKGKDATLITPQQVTNVLQVLQRVDNHTRIINTLQQRYDNISTDQLTQQMINQLSHMFPVPLALQKEATAFEQARGWVLNRVEEIRAEVSSQLQETRVQVHGRIEEIETIKAECGKAKDAAETSVNDVLRLDRKVAEFEKALKALETDQQSHPNRADEMGKAISSAFDLISKARFEVGKLRTVAEYLAGGDRQEVVRTILAEKCSEA